MPEVSATLPHETKAAEERLRPGDLYTVRDIESLFRISRRSVTNWNDRNILKPIKVGGFLRYRRDDIEALVTSSK